MEELSNMPEESNAKEEVKNTFRYFPFFNQKQPVFVLVLLGIIFYCTSLYNEYALDDGIIIHQNSYVLKGVRGIKDILTSDAYASFYQRMNATDQLQGGRYRPLSVISFALEQELIGTYKTGEYLKVEDLNKNGKLDGEKVLYTKANGKSEFAYEYNDFYDLNTDAVAQPNECFNCWDLNKNFKNDANEDLNHDGIFNEIDCQVNGSMIRHFNNIWLYVLACVLLYLVFRNHIFKENHDMAFLAALIFLAHPIHSEVVANVKSRDEIFSFIFITLCFLFSFRFMEGKKIKDAVFASVMLFLALLSKEYAILLYIIVPMALHVFSKTEIDFKKLFFPAFGFIVISSVMIAIAVKDTDGFIPEFLIFKLGTLLYLLLAVLAFRKLFLNKDVTTLLIGFFVIGMCYLAMRLEAVKMSPGVPDTEILNNPFLMASGEEKVATKIFVLLKYLILVVFPHPLISDYSYAAIAYRKFTDWDFILSLILNLSLVIIGIRLLVKRHVLGFAICGYFIYLILLSNFLYDIGATMHESLLFHSSMGIAIAFAWLAIKGFDKIQSLTFSSKRAVLLSITVVVVLLYGCKTWERNWDWKNDVTLFLKDVKTSPNSVLILGNAGARWIDLADTKEITGISIPGENPANFNDYNGQLKITDEEVKDGGYKDKREAALKRGIGYLTHAVELHPSYVNGFLNLGLAYFKLNDEKKAIYYWKVAEMLYPNNPYLNNYYYVYGGMLKDRGAAAFEEGDFKKALIEYNKYTIIRPLDAAGWNFLGNVYLKLNNAVMYQKCKDKQLQLDADFKEEGKKVNGDGKC